MPADPGTDFAVVINDEEQFSIWPAVQDPPAGWRPVGVTGSRDRCLDHIGRVWTDMRPLSTRRLGVHDLVEDQVRRRPDTIAVRDARTGDELTYAGLWTLSGDLADALTARGIGRGDVVALRRPRSVAMVVAMLGTIRSGAAYLCLDGDAPPDRVTDMVDRTHTALIVDGDDPARPRLHDHAGPRGTAAAGTRPDDPAYVMFTSGSTGTPKGVVVPHRAVCRLAVAPNFCTIDPGDRVANAANPAFDATTFEIWNTLVAGATVVVLPSITEVTFSTWAAHLAAERITTMFLTTSLFHLISRERPGALAGLGTLVVGGEQLDLAAVRRVIAAGPPQRLVNGYGPTETTTFAAYYDCDERSLAGLDRVPVGYPLQNTTLHILDEDLTPVPPGKTGELCVGGPAVALGYLDMPELTARQFVHAPGVDGTTYRTGDLARELPTGAVELVGRADRQVKLWGFRIELEEIESAAVATGLVDAAFVEKVGEGPEALLVGSVLPAEGVRDVRRRLVAELGRRLPGYMIPARWVELAEVPLTASGKVDRGALRPDQGI